MATENIEVRKLELQVRLAELENERLRLLAAGPRASRQKKGSANQLSLVKVSDPWRPLMEDYARDRRQISIPDLLAELFDIPHGRQNRRDYQRVAEILRSMGYGGLLIPLVHYVAVPLVRAVRGGRQDEKHRA